MMAFPTKGFPDTPKTKRYNRNPNIEHPQSKVNQTQTPGFQVSLKKSDFMVHGIL